jgi:NADH-quinone oxidoreductase subunit K
VTPITWYLALSAVLFAIGAVGVIVRRSLIVIFMAVELMLNAVNLAFVALARMHGSVEGQAVVLFVMAVAAAEAAVGLAIFIQLYRARESIDAGEVATLRW